MKIINYDVTLTRLTEDKIEMVRNWRNDPKIAYYMDFREYITPEMQLNWFNKINNNKNYYFIIEYAGKEIGLSNVKDIDYEKKEGEVGIFIYDDEFLNSDVPFRATLCLGEFIFEELKLEREICHVMRDNKRAVLFNKFLGFQLLDNQEDVQNQLYFLTIDKHYKIKEKLIKILNIESTPKIAL
jgi:UDP-4-amino-4,6-dideoxy-N-acetyl-beta-L-altrosamine N-acetyltransferase